jgi:hypothetical protein
LHAFVAIFAEKKKEERKKKRRLWEPQRLRALQLPSGTSPDREYSLTWEQEQEQAHQHEATRTALRLAGRRVGAAAVGAGTAS